MRGRNITYYISSLVYLLWTNMAKLLYPYATKRGRRWGTVCSQAYLRTECTYLDGHTHLLPRPPKTKLIRRIRFVVCVHSTVVWPYPNTPEVVNLTWLWASYAFAFKVGERSLSFAIYRRQFFVVIFCYLSDPTQTWAHEVKLTKLNWIAKKMIFSTIILLQ